MKEHRVNVSHAGPFMSELVCCICSYRIVVSAESLGEYATEAAGTEAEMQAHMLAAHADLEPVP